MDNIPVINTDTVSTAPPMVQKLAREIEESDKFEKVLKRIDAQTETSEQRSARIAKENEAIRARKEKNKKICDLRALIAQLRTKLLSSGFDPRVEAQLSAAQNELFWLMFSL